jgi:SAM-dependent methyltransferase
MGAGLPFSGLSFRDPDGVLEFHEGRVLRLLQPEAARHFEEVLAHPAVVKLTRSGELIGTRPASGDAIPEQWRGIAGHVYEHERVPFISHPSEWSPIMLAHAAEFTLKIALELLRAGFILKDATPNNVLFRGCRPVLVDLPSISQRAPGTFLWLARQQFEACFLLPLIASIEAGVPIAWSLQDPVAGISHARVAQMLGLRRWLKPSLISSVALPAALTHTEVKAGHASREPKRANDDQALFILERGLTRLLDRTRQLGKQAARGTSNWGDYLETRNHYRDKDLDQKRAFVRESLALMRPEWVLDIGANTGEFSALAARESKVVGIDIDEVAAGGIFDRARAQSLDVLPLVVNFARPTPAFGWQNGESQSFLQRSHNRFDFVLMLAVIHHLRVTNGVPLAAVFDTVASITRRSLLIEFVPPTDPMFVHIARGREALYEDYSRGTFEATLQRRFAVERTMQLENGRVLYLAHKRVH